MAALIGVRDLFRFRDHMAQAFMPTDAFDRAYYRVSFVEAVDLYYELVDAHAKNYIYYSYKQPLALMTGPEMVTHLAEKPSVAYPPLEGYWGQIYGVKVFVDDSRT